jgi:hypothetical protein
MRQYAWIVHPRRAAVEWSRWTKSLRSSSSRKKTPPPLARVTM